jgi:hypothetical protein
MKNIMEIIVTEVESSICSLIKEEDEIITGTRENKAADFIQRRKITNCTHTSRPRRECCFKLLLAFMNTQMSQLVRIREITHKRVPRPAVQEAEGNTMSALLRYPFSFPGLSCPDMSLVLYFADPH